MNGTCRDCEKCTERPFIRQTKKALNGVLIVCTLGLSVLVSKLWDSGRKDCPVCHHPLAWHNRDEYGRFHD
jgi:hypothetical protein